MVDARGCWDSLVHGNAREGKRICSAASKLGFSLIMRLNGLRLWLANNREILRTSSHGHCRLGRKRHSNAVVDTTRLLSFKDTHKIVLVCGIENQTIDKMADERILISNPFDIRPGGVAITANFSPKMDELKGIQGVVQVWEMIALVPPGVSREKISKLADIDNLGGKLVAPGYYK
jgi:hypothetical protein